MRTVDLIILLAVSIAFVLAEDEASTESTNSDKTSKIVDDRLLTSPTARSIRRDEARSLQAAGPVSTATRPSAIRKYLSTFLEKIKNLYQKLTIKPKPNKVTPEGMAQAQSKQIVVKQTTHDEHHPQNVKKPRLRKKSRLQRKPTTDNVAEPEPQKALTMDSVKKPKPQKKPTTESNMEPEMQKKPTTENVVELKLPEVFTEENLDVLLKAGMVPKEAELKFKDQKDFKSLANKFTDMANKDLTETCKTWLKAKNTPKQVRAKLDEMFMRDHSYRESVYTHHLSIYTRFYENQQNSVLWRMLEKLTSWMYADKPKK